MGVYLCLGYQHHHSLSHEDSLPFSNFKTLKAIQEYIEEEPLSKKYSSMQDWANADPKRAKIVVDIYLNKNKKSFRKALCFFINEKTNPLNDIEKARTILNTVKV